MSTQTSDPSPSTPPTGDTPPSPPRWRMGVAAGLVLVFALLLAVASHAVWLATTVISEDQFVKTFEPLPQDPAVAAALGARAADAIVTNNDIESRIQNLLPDALGVIAAPVTSAIQDVIANVATDVIGSDAFDQVWRGILVVTHKTAKVLLEGGERGLLVSENGEVSLDLGPLVDQVNERLMARGVDVLDGQEIDATFVLFDTDNLGVVQSLAEVIYTVRWIAPILVVLLVIGAIAFATDRRRVIVWLGTATAVTSVLVLIEIRYMRSVTVGSISDPTYKEGGEAAWSIIFDRLVAQTWALVALGLIAVVVAWFVGPSPRAVSLRSAFTTRRDDAASTAEPLTGTALFLSRNARLIQWLIVAVGVLFLLWVPDVTAWIVLLTTLAVVGAFALLEWIGSDKRAGTPTS